MISFLIWSSVTIITIIIGITARKSQKPAGFFTGVEPPKVKDIPGYNRAVSRLWFLFSALYELSGIPLLFVDQSLLFGLIPILLVVITVIMMMAVYLKIERKYSEDMRR